MKSEGIAAPRPSRGEGGGGRRGPGRDGGAAASAAPGCGGETPAGESAALRTSGPRIGPGRARPGAPLAVGTGHRHPPPLTGTGCCQRTRPAAPSGPALRLRDRGDRARTRNLRAARRACARRGGRHGDGTAPCRALHACAEQPAAARPPRRQWRRGAHAGGGAAAGGEPPAGTAAAVAGARKRLEARGARPWRSGAGFEGRCEGRPRGEALCRQRCAAARALPRASRLWWTSARCCRLARCRGRGAERRPGAAAPSTARPSAQRVCAGCASCRPNKKANISTQTKWKCGKSVSSVV